MRNKTSPAKLRLVIHCFGEKKGGTRGGNGELSLAGGELRHAYGDRHIPFKAFC